MPRIRTIKPQFWLDENLGQIPRDARLLYIGLWNLSDDQGVFEWRPKQIKAQLFPYDIDINEDNIEEWLGNLVGIGDIEQFEVNGKKLGKIPSFPEHQQIKNPSQWSFTKNKYHSRKGGEEYPNPTPALPQKGVSPTDREKEKEKEKEKGVGSRKASSSLESKKFDFDEYVEELRSEYADLNFDNELKKFHLYWSEGGRRLQRPKLALLNWMTKAREFKEKGVQGGTHQRDSKKTTDADRRRGIA